MCVKAVFLERRYDMEIKFKVNSFKRMENPYDPKSDRTKYLCYVNVKDIPDEFIHWMNTNPREQKLSTNVAKSICESLLNNKNDFHELNRGIVLSADKVKYDNQIKEVTLTFEDERIHGNIDGGHTLRIILQNKNNLTHDKYVFLEIFTGIENTVELAEARNTSVQVTQASIEELKQSFECIKECLQDASFYNRIAYKQNELQDEKNIIDVREVIAIINMFNQRLYPNNDPNNITHPIQSYTGKETSLNNYLKIDKKERDKIIHNMNDVIPTIFTLWNKIEVEFADKGKKAKKIYRTKKYSKYNNGNIVNRSLFGNEEMDYFVPKGLLYPLVGSFRALIKVNSHGKYGWKKDPLDVWENLGPDLVKTILNASTDLGDSPDTVAKASNTWDILYKAVLIYSIY